MEKKKIYISIADTGGGHRSSADSLVKVFNEKYSNQYEIMVDNVFANAKKIGKLLEKAYHHLNNRFTLIYSIAYVLTNVKFMMALAEQVFGANAIKKTAEKLKEFNPDLFVSIHPTINYIAKKSLEKAQIHPKTAIIVTDPISAHVGWASQRIYDLCIVSSEQVKKLFIRQKHDENKIKIYDPPLNPAFQKALTSEEITKIKKEFRFPENKKIIFFAGSGEGFKNIEKYIKKILEKPYLFEKAYFVVVTGKNSKQKENLEKMTEQYKEHFKIFGFTKQMFELTGSANLVICKAGPATTYQALLLKKPIIHIMSIYGQEIGTTKMLIKENYGKYIKNIGKLTKELENLIQNDEELEKMRQSVEKSKFTNGSEGIVKELINLIK